VKAAEHIARAQLLIARTEEYGPTQEEEITAMRLGVEVALAHVAIARALQEEERLDGCSRHHGQVRP